MWSSENNMFIPYPDKILIEPIKEESLLVADSQSLQEKGVVIEVGSAVKFVKKGDIVYFDSWGCSKSKGEGDTIYYTVPCNEKFILGKENGSIKKRVPRKLAS